MNDADTTVITHQNSEDSVVMSLDITQDLPLLRSPANPEHLKRYLT
ncbi:hypothetical protein [Marinomonas polaris]